MKNCKSLRAQTDLIPSHPKAAFHTPNRFRPLSHEHAPCLFLGVECHAKNIYRKLAVRSRAGAVYSAKAQGLLP